MPMCSPVDRTAASSDSVMPRILDKSDAAATPPNRNVGRVTRGTPISEMHIPNTASQPSFSPRISRAATAVNAGPVKYSVAFSCKLIKLTAK